MVQGGVEQRTQALFKNLNRKWTIRFNNFTFGMKPNGFHRIEPRTFGGQPIGQQPNPTLLANLAIMVTNPLSNLLAGVPGSSIPNDDQHPFGFVLGDC